MPSNGDQNPYGVAVVPRTVGNLEKGQILVSNFNNNGSNGGEQGTGSTIVEIAKDGSTVTLFSQIDAAKLPGACPGGVGLTTALTVLRRGWVIVGSLPTSDGTSATAKPGCLIVLDSMGHPVETFQGAPINGPWDMTALDEGGNAVLFVANVLNGDVTTGSPHVVNAGRVARLVLDVAFQGGGMPRMRSAAVIGSGFSETADPVALIIGPTGLGLATNGTLYIADTVNNRIAAIPDALFRTTTAYAGKDVTSNQNLNGLLGLAIAPNGDILTVNGGDGKLVETTPAGAQIATETIATAGGDLFGLAVAPDDSGIYFVRRKQHAGLPDKRRSSPSVLNRAGSQSLANPSRLHLLRAGRARIMRGRPSNRSIFRVVESRTLRSRARTHARTSAVTICARRTEDRKRNDDALTLLACQFCIAYSRRIPELVGIVLRHAWSGRPSSCRQKRDQRGRSSPKSSTRPRRGQW